MGNAAMLQLLKQTENPPCERFGCEKAEMCKTRLLACDSFQYYVTRGRAIATIPRIPTHNMYSRIFRDDAD